LSDDSAQQLIRCWRRLLIEIELARNYTVPFLLSGLARTAPRNPILERILPSLLHIKAVSILDFALNHLIADQGLTVPRRYGDSFKGRIDFLADQKIVSDAAVLHNVRNRRNDVAHEFNEVVSWDILQQDVSAIDTTLHALGLAPIRPQFEFFAERSGAAESTESGVAFAFDYSFGVREGEAVAAEITWTESIYRDND
jgi:hypothetical protein